MTNAQTDIVVVGSGFAGTFLAARMAAKGLKVLVLETGPAWDMGDLTSSQIWARRLKWGGVPVVSTGKHPFSYNFNSGWGFGGAALHHYGTWPRLQVSDFTMATDYGQGLDWPIGYDDLRPHYDKVQKEVGISGDAAAEVWRGPGEPYPMPPLKMFRQADVVKRGFDAKGIRTAPVPAAINSVEYGDRPACLYDGWCDAGCPLYVMGGNPLTIFKPQAEESGAEFRAHATVTRVLQAKNRATGVEYVDGDGINHTVTTKLVIIAANPVQTPRLLLASADESAPAGLANSSGALGRYFMTHSLISIFGLFEEETESHRGVSSASLISQDNYKKDLRPSAFGSYQWLIAPALRPNDLTGIAVGRGDLIGPDLDMFMRRAVRGIATMLGFGEETPQYDNRVELSDERDVFGMPKARIVHGFDDGALGLWAHMKEEGMDIFRRAGAYDVWATPMASAHMMGGAIMGRDPRTSVANSYGQTHDLPNLFVAGSSLFPTTGASNPTFTIAALCDRTSDYLLSNWRQISG